MATMHPPPLPHLDETKFFLEPWDILNTKSNVNIENRGIRQRRAVLNKGVGLLDCMLFMFK